MEKQVVVAAETNTGNKVGAAAENANTTEGAPCQCRGTKGIGSGASPWKWPPRINLGGTKSDAGGY